MRLHELKRKPDAIDESDVTEGWLMSQITRLAIQYNLIELSTYYEIRHSLVMFVLLVLLTEYSN